MGTKGTGTLAGTGHYLRRRRALAFDQAQTAGFMTCRQKDGLALFWRRWAELHQQPCCVVVQRTRYAAVSLDLRPAGRCLAPAAWPLLIPLLAECHHKRYRDVLHPTVVRLGAVPVAEAAGVARRLLALPTQADKLVEVA